MRKFFLLLLTSAVGLAFLAPAGQAQKFEEKKPEDPEKVLARLLRAVKDKDNIEGRIDAMVGLQDFGAKAEPALPDLLEALEAKNEDLRLNAAITLGKIGKTAVKPVAELLTSKDNDTVFYAIWTIGWIGPEAKETVPTMIKLASSKNEPIRRKAIFALGRLAGDPDKTLDVLVGAFKDESDEVRQAAGDALAKFGKVAVPPLMELLKSDNPKARMQASISLGEIGSDAKDAVPLLKDVFLSKADNANAFHYAQILAKLGKAGVPALEAGFRDERQQVRQAASNALQQVGAEAVGVLVDALGDKNVEVRRMAAQTLFPMRIGDKSVVIALAFALADADDQVKQWSMNALQQLGPQAKLAGPKLKEALSDMNPQIRVQSFHLLQAIGENPGPTLVKALDSKSEKVRINTACLMLTMNIETEAATPVLIGALENQDLGLKMQAASTLAQARLQKEKVLPIFLAGLKHESSAVRTQAVQGVGSFGQAASGSAADIVPMFKDSDPTVRQTTVGALQQLRGDPDVVVPLLTDIFKKGKPENRQVIMQVAHLYGDKSVDLVAGGLRDKDANVRQAAIWSVHNLGGNNQKMLPVLTKIYNDGNAEAKRTVLQVAYIFGGKAKDLVVKGLKDKDANVRQQAVFTLQNLQGDLSEAIPTIVALMKEKDSGINRNQLVWMLARGGEKGAEALGEVVKDADANTRVNALQALRNMGAGAAKAVPAIKDALKDENSQVRLWAIIAMCNIGGDAPKVAIKHFQDEKDGAVRANILTHLASHGHQKMILPLLKDAMKDSSSQVRQTTVNLIGYFGQNSEEGFEVFKMGLKDSDSQVRVNAANHGNYFGQKSWTPIEESFKTAKDSNFRQAILGTLQNTNYRSKTSLAPLIDCLKDGNVNVQQMACNVLGNIGPDAADALPMLQKIADDSTNQAVQNAARNAVLRINVKKQ